MDNDVRTHPRIIGAAGTSLAGNPSWAANRAAVHFGARGEARTAAILDALARTETGPTVFHDLRIPIPGVTANIDHLVVSGRTVLIVDTKAWKPGFLWTIRGRTRRGLAPSPACDKNTVSMARESLTRHLRTNTPTTRPARFPTPLVVVWPTSTGKVHTWAATFPGARLVTPRQLRRQAARMRGPADPHVEQALTALVNDPRGGTPGNQADSPRPWRRSDEF